MANFLIILAALAVLILIQAIPFLILFLIFKAKNKILKNIFGFSALGLAAIAAIIFTLLIIALI